MIVDQTLLTPLILGRASDKRDVTFWSYPTSPPPTSRRSFFIDKSILNLTPPKVGDFCFCGDGGMYVCTSIAPLTWSDVLAPVGGGEALWMADVIKVVATGGHRGAYATLGAAMAAAVSGDVIIIMTDTTETGNITAVSGVTVFGNGGTLTGNRTLTVDVPYFRMIGVETNGVRVLMDTGADRTTLLEACHIEYNVVGVPALITAGGSGVISNCMVYSPANEVFSSQGAGQQTLIKNTRFIKTRVTGTPCCNLIHTAGAEVYFEDCWIETPNLGDVPLVMNGANGIVRVNGGRIYTPTTGGNSIQVLNGIAYLNDLQTGLLDVAAGKVIKADRVNMAPPAGNALTLAGSLGTGSKFTQCTVSGTATSTPAFTNAPFENCTFESGVTNIEFGHLNLSNVVLGKTNRPRGYTGSVQNVAASGASLNIDLSLSDFWVVIQNADCAITITNPPDNNIAGSFTLVIIQDGVGGWTLSWTTPVNWPLQTPPTRTLTVNAVDVYSIFTYDNGSSWYGFEGPDMG